MKKKTGKIVLLSLVLAATLLISFGAPLGIPTWDDVFSVFSPVPVMDEDGLYVHFLDVGCADSAYITCDGYHVLIDAGNPSMQETVAYYLRQCGVKKLDLVIASHPDKDHIGDMPSVLQRLQVLRFWMPDIEEDLVPQADYYTDMLHAIDRQGITVQNPKPGESLQLGQMQLTVLAPLKAYSSSNNNSLVVKLTYKSNSFLFTGDAEKQSEQDILESGADVHADVLKVGHHGSKSSSTKAFLQAVSPQYAVISVGDNSYGLPKRTVIRRMEKQNIQVYRTDVYGTVVFYSDGSTVTPLTAA